MSSGIKFGSIMKEDGVSDLRNLGLKVCAAFAKALHIEREAGHTTSDALAQLDEAILLEQEALDSFIVGVGPSR